MSSWDNLDDRGDIVTGYFGIFLSEAEGEKSELLIFRDEKDNFHFVIADDSITGKDLHDPKVNGLKIDLKKYKFQDVGIKQFIDLECSLKAYINEFTEVVKEISEKIISDKTPSVKSITEVINKWKSFWASRIKLILSEDEQIGLICELKILKTLCEINATNALDSWKGPLKEKYDFVFSDWVFEVKGTRKESHIHTINGLDQLMPPFEKSLALFSFLATKTDNDASGSLQDWIDDIELNVLDNKPDLIERFYELIIGYGYSRLHSAEYKKIKFDIYDGKLYLVNDNFPRLTSDHLKKPLDNRISEVRYSVDLEGLSGENFDKVSFGSFFY